VGLVHQAFHVLRGTEVGIDPEPVLPWMPGMPGIPGEFPRKMGLFFQKNQSGVTFYWVFTGFFMVFHGFSWFFMVFNGLINPSNGGLTWSNRVVVSIYVIFGRRTGQLEP
jgi:hypothetical protein